MLHANRVVLGTISRSILGHIDERSIVEGDVAIESGASVINSTVRGPAVIGAGARIENAFVGPFTAIGDRCQVVDCEIEHSIVMCDSIVRNISIRISDSLIGKEVVVQRQEEMPRTLKLLLGDHAQVGLT
jgi:glucose-1-phosphate thymidylyltransferase